MWTDCPSPASSHLYGGKPTQYRYRREQVENSVRSKRNLRLISISKKSGYRVGPRHVLWFDHHNFFFIVIFRLTSTNFFILPRSPFLCVMSEKSVSVFPFMHTLSLYSERVWETGCTFVTVVRVLTLELGFLCDWCLARSCTCYWCCRSNWLLSCLYDCSWRDVRKRSTRHLAPFGYPPLWASFGWCRFGIGGLCRSSSQR